MEEVSGRLEPADSGLVEGLAEDWLAVCRAEGKRPSTMRNYTWGVRGVLLPYCRRQGIGRLEELDQRALDRLNVELMQRDGREGQISAYTVQTYLRPIRHFLAWACRAERPRLPRLPKRMVEILTREEIQRIEDACWTERDKLIVRVLADTGMRADELCQLRPDSLRERAPRQWFLLIQGKGNRQRWTPVPRLHRRLARFIERGRPQPSADRIFVALRSADGFYPPMRPWGVWERVVLAARETGIRKRIYPHLFRHSLISYLRRKGYNDAQISQVVGNFKHLDDYTWLQPEDTYGMISELE